MRNLAICIFRNDTRILVARGFDSVKREVFFRPLGGEVEAGETPAEAVVREITEELGADVDDLVHLGVIENVFRYEGRPGHELVSVFDGRLRDRTLYSEDFLPLREPGWDGPALWLDLSQSIPAPLYPDGLAALIEGAV